MPNSAVERDAAKTGLCVVPLCGTKVLSRNDFNTNARDPVYRDLALSLLKTSKEKVRQRTFGRWGGNAGDSERKE